MYVSSKSQLISLHCLERADMASTKEIKLGSPDFKPSDFGSPRQIFWKS